MVNSTFRVDFAKAKMWVVSGKSARACFARNTAPATLRAKL